MPLIKSKSKKAFSKNVETEMDSGKPQKQSLAIAYSVKRKAPKKKASGGTVESGSKDMNMAEGGMSEMVKAVKENTKILQKMAEGGSVLSASNEKRPMPKDRYNDDMQVGENSNKKELIDDQWTSRPDIKQSTKGMKTTPIKHPKMVKQSLYTARLRDEEDDLQSSAGTNEGPQRQPPEHDNEEDADGSGTTPEKQTAISTGRKVMAKGGKIEAGDSESHNMFNRTEMEPEENEADLRRTRTDEYHLQDSASPSEDEGDENAMSRDEETQEQTSGDPDYSKSHSADIDTAMYADGGEINTDEEEAIEHAASIAAAIMAKRKMMAEGGEVDLDLNKDEQPNGYYGQNEHMETYGEDLNDMDQPEDSNETGDDREDETENKHDASLVSKIRSKMKKKSPIIR